MSPDAKWAIHTYSSAANVPVIDLVSLPDHKVVRAFVNNSKLQATVNAVAMGDMEFFQVVTDEGVRLDGSLIKPPHFEASQEQSLITI